MMMHHLRRVSLSVAALTLVVAPLGCNSDAPPSAVVETTPVRRPSETPILDKLEREVDRDVRRTTGELKRDVDDAKKSVEESKEEARRSADKALDNLLENPK